MPTTTMEIMIQFNDDINNDKFVPLEELYHNFTKRWHMKKFYWLLLFISLLTGCASKTSAVINKLENKTDQYTKL